MTASTTAAAIAALEDPIERDWLTNLDVGAVVQNAYRMYEWMDEQGIASDSLLRELAFTKAAEVLGYSYETLYNSWLNEKPLCRFADPGTITAATPFGTTRLTLTKES